MSEPSSSTRVRGPGDAGGDPRLDTLETSCRRARERAHADVEVYERRARRRRVRLAPDGSVLCEEVEESGTAIRLRAGDGTARFAAVSGGAGEVADRACALARSLLPEPDPGWGTAPECREDDDPAVDLPEMSVLEDWLRPRCGGRHHGWAEVAWTEERWSFDGTGRARRSRFRHGIRLESSAGRWTRVQGVSGRGWPPVDPAPLPPIPSGPGAWRLAPEAAAPLIEAIARAGVLREGDPVGPGLVLSDEPRDPGGLAGGLFDDAGYRTGPTRLADGRTWQGIPEGPGHLVRPSYRDRPTPAPTNLCLAPGPAGPPRAERTFEELRLFSGGGTAWTLLLREEDGEEAILTAEPARLALRVVGTWGPAVRTRSGAWTPALLLETGG